MRFLAGGLLVSLAVAITAAFFAIWPVVAHAPWEEDGTAEHAQPTADIDALRCESALELRQKVVEAGVMGGGLGSRGVQGGVLPRGEYLERLEEAQREIEHYCD